MFYLMPLGCIDDQGLVSQESWRFTWGQRVYDRDLVAREPWRFMWGKLVQHFDDQLSSMVGEASGDEFVE